MAIIAVEITSNPTSFSLVFDVFIFEFLPVF
jgi:hypothetical protein